MDKVKVIKITLHLVSATASACCCAITGGECILKLKKIIK